MLLEYLSFFEKAKNEYHEYEVPFLGLTFKVSKDEDKILIGDKEIDFKYSSSGIQSIVPMLMVVDYCLKQSYFSSFALEEPEKADVPEGSAVSVEPPWATGGAGSLTALA